MSHPNFTWRTAACICALAAVTLLASGCASRAGQVGPTPGTPAGTGGWFCQMGADGESWDCVQDAALARTPRPDRLPQPPSAEPAPAASTGLDVTDEPGHREADTVGLADQPVEPVALRNLPGDFYTVQLVAMASQELLDQYVGEINLPGAIPARIENQGKLYYVLLLGVYETQALAEQAAAELPATLPDTTPWVRPLRSLQAAMQRGDELAGSGL